MNDSEIIELLETCGEIANCKKCSFYNAEKNNCLIKLNTYALNLIKRQQAEIDRLNIDLKAMRGAANSWKAEVQKICKAEYIDRKALGIGKCNPDIFEDKGYANGWNSAIKIIEEAPTVDVEPVKHGHWEYGEERNGSVYAYCTACHRKMNFNCYGYPHCPLCGARNGR